MYDEDQLKTQGCVAIVVMFTLEFIAILCSFGITIAIIVIALTIIMSAVLIVSVFLL